MDRCAHVNLAELELGILRVPESGRKLRSAWDTRRMGYGAGEEVRRCVCLGFSFEVPSRWVFLICGTTCVGLRGLEFGLLTVRCVYCTSAIPRAVVV